MKKYLLFILSMIFLFGCTNKTFTTKILENMIMGLTRQLLIYYCIMMEKM